MDLVVDISLEIEGYSSLINEEEMKKYIKEAHLKVNLKVTDQYIFHYFLQEMKRYK